MVEPFSEEAPDTTLVMTELVVRIVGYETFDEFMWRMKEGGQLVRKSRPKPIKVERISYDREEVQTVEHPLVTHLRLNF